MGSASVRIIPLFWGDAVVVVWSVPCMQRLWNGSKPPLHPQPPSGMRTAFSGHFRMHAMPSELGSKSSAHEHERPSNTAFAGHGLTRIQLSPSVLGSYPAYGSGKRGGR